jgi:selenide,water dikinase
MMAIAVLGWPIEKLSATMAQKVLEGSRFICNQAGITLAGGHSIDCIEPFFGLSVTGIINKNKIKKNNTARNGDFLFMTKPIGLGILSTAEKRGEINAERQTTMISLMTQLNSIGEQLANIEGLTAMTDVTGFGLLGHAIEMAEGANLSLELYYSSVPVVDGAIEYLSKRIVPDATYRNWNSYSAKTSFEKGVNVMEAFNLLPDPQTNGGLLFSVNEHSLNEVKKLLSSNGYELFTEPIGRFVAQKEKTIEVNGNLYITDNKYRLPACVDLRASIFEHPGKYIIYHIALENDDYYMNYGIYANGLLVESCSKRYLVELSGMVLV